MTLPKHGRRAASPRSARLRPRITHDSAASHEAAQATSRRAVQPRSFRRGRSVRPALSLLAMTFVGGMMIATNVPALAITATDAEPRASVYAPIEDTIDHTPQTVEVGSEAKISTLASEGYSVEAAPPHTLIPSSYRWIVVPAVIATGSVPTALGVRIGPIQMSTSRFCVVSQLYGTSKSNLFHALGISV